MEEAIVFIDGAYLSFISKHFGNGKSLKCRIEKLSQKIAYERNLWCNEIYLYTAPPYQNPATTSEENMRKANYDIFIQKLKAVKPKIHAGGGRCQKDRQGVYHQKGVDTLLTMDLLKTAQKSIVETIILLTADTDFVPIINEIRKDHKIKVILAYFTDRQRKSAFSLSNHLWDVCEDKILIQKEHFSLT